MPNNDLFSKKSKPTTLFDHVQLPEGGRVKDNTDITSYILYFSGNEANRFKKLLKSSLKKKYGDKAMERGNASDFIYELMELFADSYLPIQERTDYKQGWNDAIENLKSQENDQ